ncbi:Variant surface glycoprotein, partial [Trypanosoma congolense IL3000]
MEVSWCFLFKDCFSVFIVKERERRMIKFWIIVCLVIFGVFAQDSVTNHNGAQHKALCDVLTIAAHKWKTVRETLSPPLKKALGRTLFGKEEGELEELKDLPGDYDKVGEPGSSRAIWCGQPLNGDYQNNYPRWSGHSAPHDLVCLCTVGEGGFPFNKTGSGTAKEKLCGKPANALGGATDGWQSQSASWNKEKRVLEYPDPKGKEHITATWENVTRPCLEGGWKEKNFEKALETLIDNFIIPMSQGTKISIGLGEGKFPREKRVDWVPPALEMGVIYNPLFPLNPGGLQ